MIAIEIQRKIGNVPDVAWGLLLKGAGVVDREKRPANPAPETVSELQWDLAYCIQNTVPEFQGLCS